MSFNASQGSAPTSLANNLGFKNKTTVSIDFSAAAWNTVATHEVFTVTGMVRLLVLYYITESLTSGGLATIQFGREGSTDNYSASQTYANLVAGSFVVPAGTVSTQVTANSIILQTTSVNADVIVAGLDRGYQIGTDAMTNGTIEAICYWTPISSDGNVTAGNGGAL